MTWHKKRLEVVRLTITLMYCDPKVVRRLDVPADLDLEDLHCFIQAAMGWEDCHLWGFRARRYGKRYFWGNAEFEDEPSITIRGVLSVLNGNRDFEYEYDYGDSWVHRIRIGPIQLARTDRSYPYLVGGTGKCPPEEIGGVWGYSEFLGAFDNPDSRFREYLPGYFENGEEYDPVDAELDARVKAVEEMKRRVGS